MDGTHHLLHHHHHHHVQQQQQQQQHLQQQQHPHNNAVAHDVTDRFPQWSIQETKEFVGIRAELDQAFMETKRNKQLWEVISNKMKEKGFHRSAEQCKCKWKNLATRYKGCEAMEGEASRQQFPFYNELQSIFTARMQRMLWAEAEGGSNNNKKKAMHLSSEDEEGGGGNNEESEEGGGGSGSRRKSKKIKKGKTVISRGGGGGGKGLKEILEEFMRQQMAMEAQWMEAYEVRENERRMKEMEWRQTMEALENERAVMEQRWREREEQRRLREEARADRRDALITALLNKLSREEDM